MKDTSCLEECQLVDNMVLRNVSCLSVFYDERLIDFFLLVSEVYYIFTVVRNKKHCMSGHSKWNNIKNKKAALDAKKGKIFSQLAKNIRAAVKEGKSGDPQFNPSLRVLLDKARAANMPGAKVQKAIDVGLGKGAAAQVKEILYEGFGPGGVGFLVVGLTDNPNRTSAEIKNIFSKAGGSLGSPGCVAYMFERGEGSDFVTTMPMQIDDETQQQELQDLIDTLREYDDVEDVYCVGDWPEKE